MSLAPDGSDPNKKDMHDSNGGDDAGAVGGAKGGLRKLRYDAPSLEIPCPLYLRANDSGSDGEAA